MRYRRIDIDKINRPVIKETGYVYIISDDEDNIKVGVSKSPAKRLKQLQTGHPKKLFLIFSEEFNCTRNHLLKIEQMIHREIANEHIRFTGEWFKATKDELLDIKLIITWNRIRFENDELYFKYRA